MMKDFADVLLDLANIDGPAGETGAVQRYLEAFGSAACDGAGNVHLHAGEGKALAVIGTLDEPTVVAHGGGHGGHGFRYLGPHVGIERLDGLVARRGDTIVRLRVQRDGPQDGEWLEGTSVLLGSRYVWNSKAARQGDGEIVGKALAARLAPALWLYLQQLGLTLRLDGLFLGEGHFQTNGMTELALRTQAPVAIVPLAVSEGQNVPVTVLAAARRFRLPSALRMLAVRHGAPPVVLDQEFPILSAIRHAGLWPVPLILKVPYLGLEKEMLEPTALEELGRIAVAMAVDCEREGE